MAESNESSRSTAIDANVETLQEEKHAGGDREEARDPQRQAQPEEHVQPENDQKKGEKDISHEGLRVAA
jgi:hypothetical protein